MSETFDYVIVGAGTAGCVLANRLTADGKRTVLLLEAGRDSKHPYLRAPAAFIKTIDDPRFNWCFETEAFAGVNNRSILFPRGKVVGGSSAINGHLYVRGQARDYDTWAQLGNRGWSYDEVLPYFKRSETRTGGDSRWRGNDGPQIVSDIHEHHPLSEAFIAAAESLGVQRNQDYNGASQEGVAYYQRTIRQGRRWHVADGYLRPVRRRRNLRIMPLTHVETILFEGTRATGVRYRSGGKSVEAAAARELILCAGAIGSPHLLQISGIGPPALLQSLGIQVRCALPGVGEGFQDHYAVRVVNSVRGMKTLNERAHGPRLGWEILKWSVTGGGLLGFSPAHVGAFLRSADHLEDPDLQFVFTPASYTEGVIGSLQRTPGMTAGVWQMRPESKGYVRARSRSVFDSPIVQPAYLSAETDQRVLVQGIKWCRRLFASEPLVQWCDRETLPGAEIRSDDEILDFARNRGATVYHAIGTCRMGRDSMAVTDDRLRVHEVPGLRVVDASIMPTMVSANTNAATLMVAEKAADMILADSSAAD